MDFEVLSVLEKIAPLRTQVERVAQGLRAVNERTQSLPRIAKDVDEFERIAANVSTAWSQLDSDHLPSDVLRFLRESGSPSGAEIDLLTEPVKQWLREHSLEKAFRIRSNTLAY